MDCLVLGGTGMLGHKVVQAILKSGSDVGCTIQGKLGDPKYEALEFLRSSQPVLDSFDALSIDEALERVQHHKPRVIVNCLGIIKQREAAKDAIPSITLNSLWPHRLAEAAARWNGLVIHFSTDCVFAGDRGRYKEGDNPDARDLYGLSKFMGEIVTANSLTLRTSIIGRELAHFQSLLEWFLSQQRGSVRGFSGVWYSGLTTNHLASIVSQLIANSTTLRGLYHVAGPRITKYDLLIEIRSAFKLDIAIDRDESVVLDRSLNADRFNNATHFPVPSWRDMLAEVAADPTPYNQWQS
jgi:dTDP-4-dehydrorhamnose reductase